MLTMHYDNKVIIITGASSGIGAELARQLARQKAKLVLAARTTNNLKAVADECIKIGAETTYLETDVSNRLDCDALIKHTINTFGRIDVLINNAGYGMWSTLEELSDLNEINQIIEVNYLGSVYCTYYALKHLKATSGQIVIINSEAGKTGVPTRTGYSASKFALNGFFDSLRIELASSGVTITSVYPGFVATGAHERIPGPDGKPLGKTHIIDYKKVLTTEKCVERIVKEMSKHKREVLFSNRIRLGLWIKLISPKFLDNVAARAIKKGK
jgi:short-subunit dehydrogenase